MAVERPSNVRIRVLAEYELLRDTLEALERASARLVSDGDAAVDNALTVSAKLLRELAAYVDLEQLLVLPTLRRVDIWGNLRANALALQHEARRDELDALRHAHGHPVDPQTLAADLRDFAQALREGLECEERDVLSSDMMRDDVIDSEAD